jgi:acyl carrier protein
MKQATNANDRAAVIGQLRDMLGTVAARLGHDASQIGDDDIIPESGVVDSTGIIEFVMMFDSRFNLGLEPEDMTIDKLGSLTAIASFIASRQAA